MAATTPSHVLNETEFIGNFEQSRNLREWILFKIIFQVRFENEPQVKGEQKSVFEFLVQISLDMELYVSNEPS